MGQAEGKAEPDVARAYGVLVVEDEPIQRMMVAEHLRTKGYRVIEAATTNEAAAVLSSVEHIDIVFSDVNLSGSLGGLALGAWIREHFPAVQVILTSGNRSVLERFGAEETVPFIPKPYDPDEVERRIRLALLDQPRP